MRQPSPSTRHVLRAFIPYTRENLVLSFQPGKFFSELEMQSKIGKSTLRSAYDRALSKGLIELDDSGIPRLTERGIAKTKPYKPKLLTDDAVLLVMFDIPEDERVKRNHLRALLKELSFRKVQQSVWVSKYDHRDYILAEIKDYHLEEYVAVYEAVHLPLK